VMLRMMNRLTTKKARGKYPGPFLIEPDASRDSV